MNNKQQLNKTKGGLLRRHGEGEAGRRQRRRPQLWIIIS